MKRLAALFLCSLFVPLLIPTAVESQVSIEARMAAFEGLARKGGFSPLGGHEEGWLEEGDDSRFTVELETGMKYRIIGFCDEDCEDLDLALYGSNGDLVASDDTTEAAPQLAFTAGAGGEYEVEVRMVACDYDECGFAVGVFGHGQEGAGGGSEHDHVHDDPEVYDLIDALEELWGELGYSWVEGFLDGWLDEGGRGRHRVVLESGVEYRITGVCDLDCEDLDLALYDRSGDVVAEDVLADEYPLLEITGPADDSFLLHVYMITCEVEPCEYGVAVMRRRGREEERGGVVSEYTHAGKLESADNAFPDGRHFDVLVVEVAAGQVLTVDMRSNEFDTFLILRSPAMRQVENDDYEGSAHRSRIRVVAQESGEWEILASSFSPGATGEYEVSITVRDGSR